MSFFFGVDQAEARLLSELCRLCVCVCLQVVEAIWPPADRNEERGERDRPHKCGGIVSFFKKKKKPGQSSRREKR